MEGGHDPYFEPIVPLPELVEVKTGEEDEEVLFKHRAKVYRYCGETKQWKEKGVGDIKILKHKVSAVHRVLLRRDQVHKIAANHRITPEMELKPLASSETAWWYAMASSETAWCWYAMDFSEGHEAEGSLEHLAVRFKTADTAQEFKKVFEECQAGKTTTDQPPTYDSIFLGEQVCRKIILSCKSKFDILQEQPPGYNMVRVDVANMEQAQEAESAQTRSVLCI